MHAQIASAIMNDSAAASEMLSNANEVYIYMHLIQVRKPCIWSAISPPMNTIGTPATHYFLRSRSHYFISGSRGTERMALLTQIDKLTMQVLVDVDL